MQGPSKFRFTKAIFNLSRRWYVDHPHEKRFFVALPDIPADTEETNSILRYKELPKFDVTPSKGLRGGAKRILQYFADWERHLEYVNSEEPDTFEELFDPIEKMKVPMYYAYKMCQQMLFSTGNGEYKLVCERHRRQMEKAENDKFKCRTLMKCLKRLEKDKDKLTSYQQRMIDAYLFNLKQRGVDLETKKEYDELIFWSKRLRSAEEKFITNVTTSRSLYMRRIPRKSDLGDIPHRYLSVMVPEDGDVNKGPYDLKLDTATYSGIMGFCDNASIRKEMFLKYNGIAGPDFTEMHFSNTQIINEIRGYRHNIFKVAGLSNYADAVLQRTMVGTVQNLSSFLNSMREVVLDKAKEEVELIQEFANNQGVPGKLEAWDWEFFKNERRKALIRNYNYETAQYFPYMKVKEKVLNLCTRLFGVKFQEITDCDKPFPLVEVYQVIEEDGSEAGTLYIDAFHRPMKYGGVFSNVLREPSKVADTKPIVCISLNLPVSQTKTEMTLISLDNISSFFGEIGEALQCLLSKSPYSDVAGSNNLEGDVCNVCFEVMREIASNRNIIKELSGHHGTGEKIPDALLDDALQAKTFNLATETSTALYHSALELELNIKYDNWYPHTERIWKLYRPIPLHPEDYHPCHMGEMFVGSGGMSSFWKLWSRMLAKDIITTFDSVGFENEQISDVGRRFRDTFFHNGGAQDPKETFLQFQGRDPSLAPYQAVFNYTCPSN